MRIKLWGIRGSLPAPVPPERVRSDLEQVLTQFERIQKLAIPISATEFIQTLPSHLNGGYGGNTSCAEISSGKDRIIIDSGSGLRAFSDLVARTEPECSEYHIYFTHFHWDHLIGLPFFSPLYMKGKTVHCYAVHSDLEESLKVLFRKPNFPVPYEVVQKQIKLHKLEPRKPVTFGDIQLTPYKLDHPDPCWGARIECKGKSLAWAVDTECTRVSREDLGEDIKLYQNADLMVFDAQYSFGEALEKINWGHSSGPVGIDVSLREGIKRLLFVHHDPSADDSEIRVAEEEINHYYEELIRARSNSGLVTPDLDWRFAREGEVIEL